MFENDGKDLLGLRTATKADIERVLDRAEEMKQVIDSDNKKTADLAGKSVITLFYENSTRTRVSFELASKYMGAASANMTAAASSVQKGETLIDTGATLDMMGVDIIIMRHSMGGAPHFLAKHVKASIINAGDGQNEHPTQALLDLMTMRERFGDITGKKVAIIGDAMHSRVARSNTYGLLAMGATVHLAGPSTLLPKEMAELGAKVSYDITEALQDADVVMGLRIQRERQMNGLFPSVREYVKYFGIGERELALAKPDALLMHPGPVNRGVEISSYVADGPQSVIREQVKNGVAVRMALLDILAHRKEA
ncbi:aspartate carbamoyltransferase catalytic subunit [Eubacteriales bacterium OttesenSCG-928-M02]|nr:aspartate carbamoyltransferase catalytic subunit [Eubacteriales bacterium OttesenSCG-928-M02]